MLDAPICRETDFAAKTATGNFTRPCRRGVRWTPATCQARHQRAGILQERKPSMTTEATESATESQIPAKTATAISLSVSASSLSASSASSALTPRLAAAIVRRRREGPVPADGAPKAAKTATPYDRYPSYLALHATGELARRADAAWELLRGCTVCPQNCPRDRTRGLTGACHSGTETIVGSWNLHWREE